MSANPTSCPRCGTTYDLMEAPHHRLRWTGAEDSPVEVEASAWCVPCDDVFLIVFTPSRSELPS